MNKYQKAIEVIDTLLHLMCGEEREDGYKPTMEEMSNSMDLLKELVDKEIPKKPLDVCTPVVKWGLCPVCKGELNKLGGKPNRVFSNQKYCSDCGQALDWRNEDER